MSRGRCLDERWRVAVYLVLQGLSKPAAMRAAGYSPAYADRAATELFSKKEVQSALEEGFAEIRKNTMHTVEKAMAESEDVIAFAKLTKNGNAYFKAVELRARLAGLLQDTVKVVHVNVAGALEEARARTIPCESYRIEVPRSLASPTPPSRMVDPFED